MAKSLHLKFFFVGLFSFFAFFFLFFLPLTNHQLYPGFWPLWPCPALPHNVPVLTSLRLGLMRGRFCPFILW